MTNLHLLRGKEKARIIRQNAVLKRTLSRTRNSILTQQQEISEYEETLEIAFDELDSSLYNEPTIKLIQSDIAKLFNTKPQARRYTRETKEFAYSLLVKSESCYNFLRRVIPLPSPELLRKEFKDDVNKEERRMTNLLYLKESFDCFLSQVDPDVESVKCCLGVDAFCGTMLTTPHHIVSEQMQNYVFIFLLLPLDYNLKPYILHLKKTVNGCANLTIDEIISAIIKESQTTKVNIKYVAVDGDNHYSAKFRSQYDAILNSYLNNEIYETQPIYIADALHIFKNARSRILDKKVIVNPHIPSCSVGMQEISSFIDPMYHNATSDRSNLGKMRDSYPIQLFNFSQALRIVKSHKEAFFYFTTYALWVEALLNPDLSKDSRIYLLDTLLFILITIKNMYSCNELPSNCSQKKSASSKYVTMFTEDKLQRIIPTIIFLIDEIKDSSNELGMERFGTHVVENKIGNIRSLCNGDNRSDHIIRVTARYSTMKLMSNKIMDGRRRTRLNQGGLHIDSGDLDIFILDNPRKFAETLLGYVGICESSIEDRERLLAEMSEFTKIAPYKPFVNLTNTASKGITNRIYSFMKPDYTPLKYNKYKWLLEDIVFMEYLIMNNQEDIIYLKYSYLDTNYKSRKVKEIKHRLSLRPLTLYERSLIAIGLKNKLSFNEICLRLQCRTESSLRKLLSK